MDADIDIIWCRYVKYMIHIFYTRLAEKNAKNDSHHFGYGYCLAADLPDINLLDV